MKFKKLQSLTDEARTGLAKTLGDQLQCELIEFDLEKGYSELWEIDGGSAYAITRIEPEELVVVCYQGKNLRQAAPSFVQAAKAAGCKSIRFHTERGASLSRLLSEYEPKYIESVYRVYLP